MANKDILELQFKFLGIRMDLENVYHTGTKYFVMHLVTFDKTPIDIDEKVLLKILELSGYQICSSLYAGSAESYDDDLDGLGRYSWVSFYVETT